MTCARENISRTEQSAQMISRCVFLSSVSCKWCHYILIVSICLRIAFELFATKYGACLCVVFSPRIIFVMISFYTNEWETINSNDLINSLITLKTVLMPDLYLLLRGKKKNNNKVSFDSAKCKHWRNVLSLHTIELVTDFRSGGKLA